MSLRQKVKLEFEDRDEVVVEYSAVDLRAWETKHKRSALNEDMSVVLLSWLGWNAAVRQGLLNGECSTYEGFDARCTSVEGVADDTEDEGPTKGSRKGRGAGSSAP